MELVSNASMRATYLAHLTILDLITVTKLLSIFLKNTSYETPHYTLHS